MSNRQEHICPVQRAGLLDIGIRRWLQNPRKLLNPYIKDGMTVLDVGCGPGFFSVEMARMVGGSGRVIAADLQDGMLQRVRSKIKGTELENRITLHKCEKARVGVTDHVDFVLLFYMVHEVPSADNLFTEIVSILKPGGKVFIAEPSHHVSKSAFEESIRKAEKVGFKVIVRPRLMLSRAVVLGKG